LQTAGIAIDICYVFFMSGSNKVAKRYSYSGPLIRFPDE
jgi:hypothetical protein